MNIKETLLKIVKNDDGKYTSSRMTQSFFVKNHNELILPILETTFFYSDDEINFTKRILLVVDGINSRMICPTCSKDIDPSKRGENSLNFRKFCSGVCAGVANKGTKHVRTKVQQKDINDKRKNTMLSTHGYEFNSQRPEVKKLLSVSKYTTHNTIRYDLLENREYIVDAYKTLTSTEIGEVCCCDYSVVLDYLRKYGVDIGGDHTKTSSQQREIRDFIESLGYTTTLNDKVLGSVDIDVYVPDMRVGIEYNGFPWHLDNFTCGKRGRSYHINKTNLADKNDIRLIHVFPHDWQSKKEIILSVIRNALHKTPTKIYGRQCKVGIVEKSVAKEFLDQNHLSGNTNFDVAIGLYRGDDLVHVTTFGVCRFDKKYDFEIIRSASKINVNVVGGFSKCFSHFVSTCEVGTTIMTYADRSISAGNSYVKSGFDYVGKTEPNYHYVNRDNGNFVVHSRYKFQKHKLVDFPNYDETKSEWEIMKSSGYDRFWDCGNNKFVHTIK